MLTELKLARAFLWARQQSLARLTTALAIGSLALGVAALITSLAVAAGFSGELQTRLLANSPHIAIQRDDGSTLADSGRLVDAVRSVEGVTEAVPSANESAVVLGASATEYAVLRTDDSLADDASVVIGHELARRSGLGPGDRARIVVFWSGGTLDLDATVAGTFKTGILEYDAATIRISPAYLARLRGEKEFTPTMLEVRLADPFRSAEIAEALRARIGGEFRVIDWQEANRPLFAALSAERRAAAAVIFLMVVIAAVNITTSLAMVAGERRGDIAVLRTCGMTSRRIAATFVFAGLVLGAAGAFIGTLIGSIACAAANRFELLRLPGGVYSIDYIPLRSDPLTVVLVVASALAVAALAASVPARLAARTKPLELLRTQ
ncbi:MAG: FtsX-like permease family protein [Pyrinomonadaceae bacterium]